MKGSGIRPMAALQRLTGLLALLLILPAEPLAGEPLVSGHAAGAGGREIRLEISVGSPPPATVIVTLKLPAGTAVEQAQPAASRFDHKSGEAKWLLSGLGSGRFIIKLQLSRPVTPSELSGRISYKHPATGAMQEEEI